MNTETVTEGRRVVRRCSAADREQLIREYEASGKSRKAFCEERGINLGTFHGWFSTLRVAGKRRRGKARGAKQKFAEVTVAVDRPGNAADSEAEIEIGLPNGSHVWIRPGKNQEELAELIRGVAGC
ncbi:hypothetical protein ACFLQU_02445 [Verrucomicrobiota bacterium]